MKPVLPGELRATLLGGGAQALLDAAENATVAPLPVRPLSVLLVEDHPINTHFVTVLLERHGHRVVHASNGHQGLDISARGGFDIILMDVQMPVMDGLEATRRIRAREASMGQARVPIVALTANAMKGDAEACLEAGMDRFVSKPIHVDALHRVLAELTDATSDGSRDEGAARASQHPASAHPASQWPRPAPYDRAALLSLACGDQDFAAEILTIFLQSHDAMMSALRHGVGAGDAVQVRQDAHRIKGALELVCAYGAADLARALEAAGHQKRASEFAPLLERLEIEVQRLHEAAILDTRKGRGSAPPAAHAT
jgi:CheY-like chemotaxis protein